MLVGPLPEPVDQPLAAANLRAALCLLRALAAGGLSTLVLCPGSRSAPLAQAAALLEADGLRLLTAIDERSAAFLALGWGRASGRPAAVVTTSGTAVANLLPAAVEADWGAVPLLLLSADRPARLKGCGANQTVNQEAFLTAALRWFASGDPSGLAAMGEGQLQSLAARALAATQGFSGAAPGPVQLNLPFDEPLHSNAGQWQQLQGVPVALPTPAGTPEAEPTGVEPGLPPAPQLDPDRGGVVIAGPWRGLPQHWPGHVAALGHWLRRSGWPLLADGLSNLRGQSGLQPLAGYDLLLTAPDTVPQAPQVLRLGPLPASRRLQQWLEAQSSRQVLVSEGEPRCLDPLGLAEQWSGGLERWCSSQPQTIWQGQAEPANRALLQGWRQRDAAVQQLLDELLMQQHDQADETPLNEPALARQLSRLLPPGLPLVLANSSPVRDWESFADPAAPWRPVFGFRGASGIDGTLSIACGVAEALGQAALVTGDLALLHDSNGWLWRRQLQGRLTVLLINNGGGGIFEQLPIRHRPGSTGLPMDFDRLFAMPQAVDQGLLCAAHGVAHRRLAPGQDLAGALSWALDQSLAVLELQTDRRADAALRQRLRTMAPVLAIAP